MAFAVPGTKGMSYLFAASLAESLLPIIRIASPDGPTNIKPEATTLSAKEAFSDKKP